MSKGDAQQILGTEDVAEMPSEIVEGKLVPTADFSAILEHYATEMQANSDDPAGVILSRILSAETLDDALGSDVLEIDDLDGGRIQVIGFSLQKSTFKDGNSYYAVLDVNLVQEWEPEKGWVDLPETEYERVVVTTGSSSITAQLLKAAQRRAFPFMCVVRISEVESSGNTVKRLVRPAGKAARSIKATRIPR